MTEDEAKTRWCPFTRLLTEAGTGNRVMNKDMLAISDIATNCIGSQCMAFRWRTSPAQAAEVNARGNAGATPDGYCGLAGKP